MGYTLAEARSIVADHLDDAANDRWSASQLDYGLKYALDACISEYLAAGGDRLNEILSTTSTVNGTVSLSSYDPKKVSNVTLVIGNVFFPIQEVDYHERVLNDQSAKTVEISYVRTFVLPTTTSHPLVGNGATAAKSFGALENWICARAALFCSVKDAESRPELRTLEQEMKDAVMLNPSIPKSLAFPDKPHAYSNWFAWAYKPDTQTIQIGRKGWF